MEQLLDILKNSKFPVALTGAGVSTLSGIPDFRSEKHGLWNKYDPMEIFSLSRFIQNPEIFYNFAFQNIYSFLNKKPSVVHRVLAILERENILKAVITQNIDRLHQMAGSSKIVEMHGSIDFHTCLNCGKHFKLEYALSAVKNNEMPFCNECNSILKPEIIFFEEPLPEKAVQAANKLMVKADLLLILGSSMQVYPVAGLPSLFLESGGQLVIVNKQPTQYDPYAILKLSNLEKVFTSLERTLTT